MELWFAALALGASRVIIVASGLLPPTTRRLLEEQLDLARQVLSSIGEPPERLRLATDATTIDWGGMMIGWTPVNAGELLRHNSKRDLLNAALATLMANASNRRPYAPLAGNAPFGGLAIDAEHCTLCQACAQCRSISA